MDHLAWFKEADLTLIKEAEGSELQVLTEPPIEFGWGTGREALLGEKKTVEEAAAIRRALRDAKKAAPSPAPPLLHVKKPVAPQPHVNQPGPSSSDADGMDLDLALTNLKTIKKIVCPSVGRRRFRQSTASGFWPGGMGSLRT